MLDILSKLLAIFIIINLIIMITLLKANDLNRMTKLLDTADFLQPSEIASIQQAFLKQCDEERWLGYQISGNISGIAYVSKANDFEKKWAIKFLYVRPDMRGWGVSKTLVKYIEMKLDRWKEQSPQKVHSKENSVRDYYEFFNRWGYIYL